VTRPSARDGGVHSREPALLNEIRHDALLWLLAFVPVLFAGKRLRPEAHTPLFVLSVLAIVPRPSAFVAGGAQALAADQVSAVAVRDRQRVAVLPVARLELSPL